MSCSIAIYEYLRQENNDILLKHKYTLIGWEYFDILPFENQSENMSEIKGEDLRQCLSRFNKEVDYIVDDKYYILDISF